jgi:hypothetical protein
MTKPAGVSGRASANLDLDGFQPRRIYSFMRHQKVSPTWSPSTKALGIEVTALG